MTQPVATSEKDFLGEYYRRLLCFYINATSRIQVIRVTNLPNSDDKRVVFPGERLMFEVTNEAELEIYSSDSAIAIPTEIIPCQEL